VPLVINVGVGESRSKRPDSIFGSKPPYLNILVVLPYIIVKFVENQEIKMFSIGGFCTSPQKGSIQIFVNID
jgi:hypothetical protein